MGMMRRRARRRVLAAGAAGAVAYRQGKKRGMQSQEYEEEPVYPEAAPERSGPDAADLEEIQKLAELHQSGALTDEEFAAAKAKLLS